MAFKHCQKTDEMLVCDMDIHKFSSKIPTGTYIQTWPPPQYPGGGLPYERSRDARQEF